MTIFIFLFFWYFTAVQETTLFNLFSIFNETSSSEPTTLRPGYTMVEVSDCSTLAESELLVALFIAGEAVVVFHTFLFVVLYPGLWFLH